MTMTMTKKDKIQKEIIKTIVNNNFRGIVLSSVRSGKTRILLKSIIEDSTLLDPSVLVLYPNIDIKNSWETECELINYTPNITYCTFMSIEKIKDEEFDYVIIDEAHLLGEENQLPLSGYIAAKNKKTIFASGTYTEYTLDNLMAVTGMDLIVNYSTEQAIKDGIITDFNIIVHQYELNNKIPIIFGKSKKWQSTDKRECNRLTNRIQNTGGQAKMFASLERMRFINSCSSLINTVTKWIAFSQGERFILFVADEKVGLRYKIPMFNSKSKDDSVLKQFQKGEINQLCLIKKGSAGVTYPNLDTILITAINSNGENLEQMLGRSLLDDTSTATIHIFVSTESFQIKWLNSALENIDKKRVKYINN